MRQQEKIVNKVDWSLILLFGIMVIFGWLNIYAAVYDEETPRSIFDLGINSGKQLIWILTTVVIITVIMVLDFRFFSSFSYIIFALVVISLILVLFFGKYVSGSRSWFEFGFMKFQPAEFAKYATALVLAKYMSENNVRLDRLRGQLSVLPFLVVPMFLILLQPDTGTVLVFLSFVIPFYREGLPPVYIILGLGLVALFILTLLVEQLYLYIALASIVTLLVVFGKRTWKRLSLIALVSLGVVFTILSVDFVLNNVMLPHQQRRIQILFNPGADPLGDGWNVTQSKIAIGSGGFAGKGFLEGTQTKFDFVPEQSTDFIFCTIGEEHGWIGSLVVVVLFLILLARIMTIAERQKSHFARIYGYCVAGIFFFHFMINLGMTIGLFPVIGIPLPFFSYGGSSLWSFTILLFTLIKLDAHRMQVLVR